MHVKDGIKKLDIEQKASLVTGSSFWTTAECSDVSMPSVRLSDGPHGLRVQKKDFDHTGTSRSLPSTCFPTASAVACSFDEDLCKAFGECVGREAASMGVGVLLGPGVNVKRSPLCGRNFEYYSEDCYLSGKLGSAFIRGVQSTGVTACVKHFAANSREYARFYYDSRVDEQTLRETYFLPFEMAVKYGGVGAVMTAYNKLNGEYCNSSSALVSGILRGQWGFDGLVVSDWGGSYDRVKSLQAGVDLEMPQCKFSEAEIISAVKQGTLREKCVDEAVYHIRRVAANAQNIKAEKADLKKQSDFARQIAEQSAVLLKNEGVLPLTGDEKVALFGALAEDVRYQGSGSSRVNPTDLINFKRAFEQSGLNYIGYEKGYELKGETGKKVKERARKLAEKADVSIVCLGLDERSEAEGVDRKTLSIGQNQIEFLKQLASVGKKVVAVLCCGSSVLCDWDDNVSALLLAHLGGQRSAEAVVNVLTGKVNPSGRLAETYPLADGCEPCAAVYDVNPLKSDYAEGIFVGYKYYTALNKGVKYPFGYGLSYTEFEYSDFFADASGVRFTVKNVGKRCGAAVPQVYVKAPRALHVSPFELKAFAKINLQSGEERQVCLPFDEFAFRRWDKETASFVAGGEYEVTLNTDCTKALFAAKVKITEENLPQGCAFTEEDGKKLSYEEYYSSHLTEDVQPFVPYKGMEATLDTQAAHLGYCEGLLAKIFGVVVSVCKRSKEPTKAAVFDWLPVRSLMQFMGFNKAQADGFLLACNGHFFKGIKKIIFKK